MTLTAQLQSIGFTSPDQVRALTASLGCRKKRKRSKTPHPRTTEEKRAYMAKYNRDNAERLKAARQRHYRRNRLDYLLRSRAQWLRRKAGMA